MNHLQLSQPTRDEIQLADCLLAVVLASRRQDNSAAVTEAAGGCLAYPQQDEPGRIQTDRQTHSHKEAAVW